MSRIKPYGKTLTVDSTTPSIGYGNGITAWEPLPVFQNDEYYNQVAYELVDGGTGRIEITNAPIESVNAEIANPNSQSNVVASAWDSGDVDYTLTNKPTIEISPPPTAWRIVSTNGTITVNGRATA